MSAFVSSMGSIGRLREMEQPMDIDDLVNKGKDFLDQN